MEGQLQTDTKEEERWKIEAREKARKETGMELLGTLRQPAWLLKGSTLPVPGTHFLGSVCL